MKIIGYEKIFKELIRLNIDNKLPKKFIISGKKGIGKSSFAKKLINFLLSSKAFSDIESSDYLSFNKYPLNLNKFTNQNFFNVDIADDKNFIEIDQIRTLIKHSQKKSLNNFSRFVLINNIELMNKNASNALLKILEEPNDDMYFILTHNSQYKILETIKSRCLNFNVFFTFDQTIKITNEVLNINIEDYLSKSLIHKYTSVGELIFLYNFSINNKIDLRHISLGDLINHIIDHKLYKADKNLLNLSINLIEAQFYENYLISKDIKFYNFYKYFTNKFFQANRFNLDLESLFLEVKSKRINE